MTGTSLAGSVRVDSFPLWAPTSHRDNQGRSHRKGVRANGSLGRNVCHASEWSGEPPPVVLVPIGFSKWEIIWGGPKVKMTC